MDWSTVQGKIAWGAIVVFCSSMFSGLGYLHSRVVERPTVVQVEKTLERMVLTREDVRNIIHDVAPYNTDRKLIENQFQTLTVVINDLRLEIRELRTEINILKSQMPTRNTP